MSKLIELRQKYGAALDTMEKHAEAGGEEYTQAEALVKSLGEAIERQKNAEQMKAAAGVEVKNQNPQELQPQPTGIEPQAKDEVALGTRVSRCLIALAANKGIGRLAAEFAQEKWGNQTPEVARALAASVGPSGGFLVPPDFRAELIELLRPASVVMRAGPRRVDLPHGNLTIPGVATGAQAEYVGENQNIKKTEQSFRSITLSAKKLAALVPISNDMLRYPSISTDAFVRQDLVNALAQRGDLALLRGDGTQFSPKGLRAWAMAFGAVVTPSDTSAQPALGVVTGVLAKAELYMEEALLPMTKPVWFMSPRVKMFLSELRDPSNNQLMYPTLSNNGTLRGKPVYSTTQIPNNLGAGASEIYLADMDQMIVGESIDLELTVQDGAAYFDGTQVISGFSQDQTVIRALTAHDTGFRYGGAVVLIDDVRWTPA